MAPRPSRGSPHATAIGFAPHSGWAAFVALGGSATAPEVVARGRIEMADPGLDGSRQPYHEVEGLPLGEAERRLERLRRSAWALAAAAVAALVTKLATDGHPPSRAGILESSGRSGASLAAILASHALIHTADGAHFRDALEDASRRCGLAVERVAARALPGQASAVLGRTAEQLQAATRALGKPLGPPWGADQKQAALLAWLLLASSGDEAVRAPARRAR